jgi:hypothetical protein
MSDFTESASQHQRREERATRLPSGPPAGGPLGLFFMYQRQGFVNSPSDLWHPGRQSDAIGNKLMSCRLVDKIKVKSLTVKSEILTELVSHTTKMVADTNFVKPRVENKGLTSR